MSRIVSLALVVVMAGACGGNDVPVALVRESAVAGGALPLPTGDVILEIVGRDGALVPYDLALLEQHRTVEATLHEPFIDADHVYRGVLVADLLASAGLPGDGKITMTALDDYVVVFEAGDLDGAILATREDGAVIPVATGGPIRIVFLPDSDFGRNTDHWIWSVRTIALTSG